MKKHFSRQYKELPVGWIIQTVYFTPKEERQGGEEGWFHQGLNINTGFKTCMYKDYAQALAMVKDYASQPKYAAPWGC